LQDILMKDYPLKREALTPQAQLADLDIDSLGVMELLFSIEDEFGLDVPNDKQDLKTIGDVVAYIDRLVAQQHADGGKDAPHTDTAGDSKDGNDSNDGMNTRHAQQRQDARVEAPPDAAAPGGQDRAA
jgi:acyl carrier protein